MMATLYYIHDPMCSWCWGYRPAWHQLETNLPSEINVEYVAGGLAPDSDEAMPIALQQSIQSHWHTIQAKLGTEFNFDFWQKNTPRRSTYNACRAVIAAKNQGLEKEMLAAIQQGYYLRALNPSDKSTLITLAQELAKQNPMMNTAQFSADLSSAATQTELMRQIELARTLTHRGFPSLVLEYQGKQHFIAHDYQDNAITLKQIMQYL
ncbi:DsbA family protein [Colwellia asteriadis]